MISGIIPRLYQEIILETAIKSNTLVVLPTGLGKTAVAALVIAHRLQNYPDSKILFLAPTKPLAQQHEKSLKSMLPNYAEKTVLFTGTVKPEKRQHLWEENQIIISTPQGMENDVMSRKINLKEASLVVFDEAHRATGDYAYVFIAEQYKKVARHERILALTASPGTDQEKILEICNNLNIDEIEYRSKDAADVKEYIQELKSEFIFVDLEEDMLRIKSFLEKCYNSKLEDAVKLGYLQGNPSNYNKLTLLKIISGLQGKIAQGEKDYEVLKTISLVAEALKIQHALELLETQDIVPLLKYMKDLQKQADKGKTKSVKNLVKDLNFRSALILTKTLIEENARHPKLDKIKEIVKNQLLKNEKSKIIIFAQYRDSGTKIKEVLSEENISSEMFVGQAKKRGTGLSQKEQKAMIESFEKDEFNCLIATSVGEEGLDIPEVDLVIFYEPIPSAIRTVQRRGRTGRQKEGKVITLITRGTRDEGYRWSAYHKEKRMYRVLEKIKDNLHKHKKTPEPKNDLYKFISGSSQTTDSQTTDDEIIIKADYREKGSQVLKELLKEEVKIDLESLSVGDFHLSENIVVEFKTTKDFVDSIIDGRILSQAKELKQYYKPFIIIQGEEDIYSQRRIHPNAIRGMITALVLGFRIPIIQTKNAIDTAGFLKQIAKREQSADHKDWQMHTAKPLNDKEIQEYIISSIPDIGPVLAPELLKHFKTIKNIANATEEQLQEIPLIGKIKAKRIKELMNKDYLE